MKIRLLVLLTFLLSLTPTFLQAQQFDFSKVDKLLQDSLEILGGTGQSDFGGVCVIVSLGENIVYNKSYNLPGKTVSDTRLMPIASASKWSSGLVIMGLVQDGLLSLDDSCGKFFPNLSPEKASITIRQLFTFTSGFAGNLSGPTACVEDIQFKGTLAECVNDILNEDLSSSPGQFLNYGSNSMHIAGRMAEMASGLPYPSGECWDSLYAKYVKQPLGMTRTGFDVPPIYFTANPRIDGGVYSTALEYVSVPTMLVQNGMYKGKQVLSPENVEIMCSDQTQDATILYSPFLQFLPIDKDLAQTRYGIGCWLEKKDPLTNQYIEVASQGKFGFSPFYLKNINVAGVLAVKSNEVAKVYPTYYKLKQLLNEIFTLSSVNENEWKQNIYPNPTNGLVTFRDSNDGEVINIYNTFGELVLTKTLQSNSLNIQELPSGVYLIVSSKGNNTIVKY
ncbi:MAG: serine hydrolase [Candidatus Kapabacteria bacterium]|nr:serine hydrolase [Candidatus Kapabacteria bacterium]